VTLICGRALYTKFEGYKLELHKVKAKMAERLLYKNQDTVELGNVEGDVEIRNCRTLVPEEGESIVITGTLFIVDELEIHGSLQCGRLESKSRDQITVNGNLIVEKAASIPRGSLAVYGDAKARDIEVGASFLVEGNLDCVSAKAGASIKVTGDAKAQRLTGGASVKIEGNVDVERVSGGGSVGIYGKIQAEEFDAGGSGKTVRGFIKKVSVGGSFKAEDAIEIEDLDVGGAAKVGPGSKVSTVDIGGTFKAEGDFTFDEINVGGTVKIMGNATGRLIDVGGTVKTDGNLEVSEGLNVGGTAAIGGNLKSDGKIKVGGTVRAEGRIDTFRIIVGGEIRAEYIRATDGFRIGKRSEVRGFVESNEILIRERARTDSLYGNDIRIEERARVGSLYGKTIYIERDAYVEGEVLFTDSLEAEDGVTFREEPRKVDQLPPPEQVS